MTSRYFADRSNDNPTFDAEAYAAAGHVLVGWKATEGVGFVDPNHERAVHEAHAHGIGVLHYHYCRPDRHPEPEEERVAFTTTITANFEPYDRIALDFEVHHPHGVSAANRYLREFAAGMTKVTRLLPVLYMNTSDFNEHGPACLLPRQRIWLANYSDRMQRPYWARDVWAWQYTDGYVGSRPRSIAGAGRGDASLMSPSALRGLSWSRRIHRVRLR